MKSYVLVASVLVSFAGCSSLVDDPCAPGFVQDGAACVAPDRTTGVRDPGPETTLPVGVCTADTTSDPDNCGRCGHVCRSGLCSDSVCVGDPIGHLVVIGHDFTKRHAGMARLLGNALALGDRSTVRIGWVLGSGSMDTLSAARSAAIGGLGSMSRHATQAILTDLPTTASALSTLDVLVVVPQFGNGDALELTATHAATALHAFLVAGGVIVLLESMSSTTDRLAHGANLIDLGPAVDVTGQPAFVISPADALAQQVPIPYLAETHSVGFATSDDAVVTANPDPVAVVLHRTY